MREHSIARILEARNQPELFAKLRTLKGSVLVGRYCIEWLYAVGGQGILYVAKDAGGNNTRVLVKLAMLPYHRPAYIEPEAIQAGRRRIVWESHVLHTFRSSLFPVWYDLVYTTNPLHAPERGTEIVDHEPFLIMEFIEGELLDRWARTLHRDAGRAHTDLKALALELARRLSNFCLRLWSRDEGYLYSDLRPQNILIGADSDRPIRVIDAGSVIPARENPDLTVPFAWAYLPNDFYQIYSEGQQRWPDQGFVIHTLGKVLYQVLTNIEPVPGRELLFGGQAWDPYPVELREYVQALMERRVQSFAELHQETLSLLSQMEALEGE